MNDIYSSLDILVSSSISEGFPNVIGEAMACGVPCVATNAGDSSKIVGELGYVVDVANAQHLSTKIIQTIEEIKNNNINKELIRKHIENKFSVNNLLIHTKQACFQLEKQLD